MMFSSVASFLTVWNFPRSAVVYDVTTAEATYETKIAATLAEIFLIDCNRALPLI